MLLFVCGFNEYGQLENKSSCCAKPENEDNCDQFASSKSFICKFQKFACIHRGHEVPEPRDSASPEEAPGKAVVGRGGDGVRAPSDVTYKVVAAWGSLMILDKTGLCVQGFCDEKSHQQRLYHGFSEMKTMAASWNDVYFISGNGQCSVVHDLEFSSSPIPVTSGDFQFVSVSSGDTHTVAVTDDGDIGEIEKKENEYVFRPLSLKIKIKAVSCGKEHVLMLSRIGVVLSFGLGGRGQLGHGNSDSVSEAQVVEALEGVTMTSVSAGGWHSLALSDIGDVYAWGWNESGQVGQPSRGVREHNSNLCKNSDQHAEIPNVLAVTNTEKMDDVQIQTLPNLVEFPDEGQAESTEVTKVSCGSRHSAAVTVQGDIFTWGWNAYGQLGTGDRMSHDRPVMVDFFSKQNLEVRDVNCGYWNTVVMTTS